MDTRNRDSPVVYICSRYSGDVERNTELARQYSRLAVERGCVPLTPHLLLPQFLSEETEREKAICLDLRFLGLCQELWVCGPEVSEGMRREIKEETGMTVSRIKFNRTSFFEPSNTLMCNFTAFVKDASELSPNREIDSYQWFTPEEARQNIRPNSLAERFLNAYLDESK